MSHITDEQRCIIQRMKKAGHQQKQFAEAIGKSASAVSRELRRNCDGRSGEYNADLAARKCAQRKRDKPRAVRFTTAMRAEVERQLAQKFSPEQIVGLAEREGRDMVSHARIYQHVWQDKKRGGTLHEHLRTRGKRNRKRGAAKDSRGIIVGRVDIELRPVVVEQRKRFGDLEMDTIIGKGHQGAILTINERATGMLRIPCARPARPPARDPAALYRPVPQAMPAVSRGDRCGALHLAPIHPKRLVEAISTPNDYIPVLIQAAIAVGFVGFALSAAAWLGPKIHGKKKDESFECGIEQQGNARKPFSVKYLLIAILFVLFDVEVIFLYPWAVNFKALGAIGFVEMIVFVGFVLAGLYYVLRKGVMKIE